VGALITNKVEIKKQVKEREKERLSRLGEKANHKNGGGNHLRRFPV